MLVLYESEIQKSLCDRRTATARLRVPPAKNLTKEWQTGP